MMHKQRYPGFTTLLTNLLKSSVDHVADERVRMMKEGGTRKQLG